MAMKLFLISNSIVSLILSQSTAPIDEVVVFDDWLAVGSGTGTANCEAIGGFNTNSGNIKSYGGQADDTQVNELSTSDETYSYTATSTTLSTAVQVPNIRYASSGDVVYYVSGSEIRGIDLSTDTDILYANRVSGFASSDPGVCVDPDDGTIYTVGDTEIETCANTGSPPSQCTSTSQQYLIHKDYNAGLGVGELQAQACAVYNGELFVFGGLFSSEPGFSDSIWQCAPAVVDSCDANVTTLSEARGAIRVVELADCVDGKYVALIGGRTGTLASPVPSAVVEIFDLKNSRLATMASLPTGLVSFLSAYDPVHDQIFTVGGITDNAGTCTDQIYKTNTSAMGLCVTSQPSMDPTTEPTKEPTDSPTVHPTNTPTEEPTTSDPTNDPTVVPTANPSTEPTTAAPVDSPSPTDAPTLKPTLKVYVPKREEQQTSALSYTTIVIVLVFICCIICCCFYWYDRNECQEEEEEQKEAPAVYDRMEQGDTKVAAAAAAATTTTTSKASTASTYERKPQVPPSSDYGNYVDVIAAGGDEKSAVAMTSTAAYNKK